MKSNKKSKKSQWEVQIGFSSDVCKLSRDGKAAVFNRLVSVARVSLGKNVGIPDLWSGLLSAGNRVVFRCEEKINAIRIAEFCKMMPEALDVYSAGTLVEE